MTPEDRETILKMLRGMVILVAKAQCQVDDVLELGLRLEEIDEAVEAVRGVLHAE